MYKSYLFAALLLHSALPVALAAQDHSDHAHTSDGATQSVLQDVLPATSSYVCPMHPQIVQATPGSCPICGMDLVAQKQQRTATVEVNGAMQQALAIRTEAAAPRTLWRFIQTYAQVQYPEDAIHHSHIRAEGWIEQLHVRTLGQRVKAGDKLFSYYAPDLLVAQDDYLQALSVSKQNGERSSSLLKRAETRLRLLGLTDNDINNLQQSRQSQYQITVYAHQDGVVTMLNVRDGMYISPGDTLIEITRLDRVWLLADVPEAQQSWLFSGMSAEVDLPSQQINGLEASVDYIYPALDALSRSSKVRLTLDNRQQLLKPNMLLPVRLYGGPLRDVLAIPRDAVLLSGNSSRVVVKDGDSFSVRQITTGSSAQGYVQVLSGLHEGEQVVVSGQFLLDAEASLSQLPVSSSHQH
ncbi:efflux RND transporter periplasmic adaptor subunit [Rheinheimera nanhaiensis]|uniref:Heavy metal efflux system protein n=1 Tax=Rheinheimera nanhaiensis E407-8 TaxID=562729 RepID=I1DSY3_9GAMM|nr:efflux RND transporter periplasmic adaptor subunit [Rheinheimera nanhaiensis]GAB57161.1 heavy metal efflux system protein [Rheinheimera nanhaiensis E407-8]